MPRSSPGSSEGAGLAAVAEMRARVFSTNACDAIPGCPIKIDKFLPRMWSAVAKGFIPQAEGEQLQEGLLRGFKLGVDPNLMAGHRWFQNYPSATTTGRTGVHLWNNELHYEGHAHCEKLIVNNEPLLAHYQNNEPTMSP